MKRSSLVFALLLLAVASGSLYAQIGPSPGPGWHYLMTTGPSRYGQLTAIGDTLMLKVNRNSDTTVNLNVYFYSCDFGKTWDSMPPLPHFINYVCFLPGLDALHIGGLVGRSSDSGVYYITSFDFGKTWDTVGAFPIDVGKLFTESGAINRFAISWNPASASNIWFNNDVRSKDGGKTWSVMGLPPTADGHPGVYSLLFDRRDPTLWYVAASPSDESAGPIFYQTTDDGASYNPILQWAQDAGVAHRGEMRSWSCSAAARLGGYIAEDLARWDTGAVYGYNTYSPFDPDSVPPTFVDLFSKVFERDTGYYQEVSFTYLNPPKSYILHAFEYLNTDDSILLGMHDKSFLTSDDGSTVTPLVDIPNYGVGLFLDPLTGRLFGIIYRDSNIRHTYAPEIDSIDYWYTDKYTSLFGFSSSVLSQIKPQVSLNIVPSILTESAEVRFGIAEDSYVKLEIFDIEGRFIETLLDSFEEQGEHSIRLTPDPQLKTSGMYFLRMITPSGVQTTKFILE